MALTLNRIVDLSKDFQPRGKNIFKDPSLCTTTYYDYFENPPGIFAGRRAASRTLEASLG
jgi:hypothetical protein